MQQVDSLPKTIETLDPVWITLTDGCRLAATIWLPSDAGQNPVPALLEYLPYRRRDFTAIGDSIQHAYYAGHGYASVRVDARGCGDSDGIMYDEYLPQELADGVEIINWLSNQEWCSGNVGMFGISWGGFNSLQIAALKPPPLKAIISACSTDDRYADDVHYMGGCLLDNNIIWASTMFGFNSRPPDPAIVGDRWRDMWFHRLEEGSEPWVINWLSHQRRDEQWKHGSVCENYDDIECAVYMFGGWADGYTNAIPRTLAGLKCPRKGLIGPWSHAWGQNAKPGPRIGWLQEALRWWDYWLKDIETGIMDEPMLTAWMQDYVPPAHQYEERPGRWIAEPMWPSPNIENQSFWLGKNSLELNSVNAGSLSQRSLETCGAFAGDWCPYGYSGEMPLDQRLDDGSALNFDSAPLEESIDLLGAPILEAQVTVDQEVAFIAVWLSDISPDGAATRLTYGLLNLNHQDGHASSCKLIPGKQFPISVQLNDLGQSIPPGHRIRLSISTSYWPMIWPSPQPVALTLFTGSSKLILPFRQRQLSDHQIKSFSEPESARPIDHTVYSPYARSRKVERDFESGMTRVHAIKDRGSIHLHGANLTYSGKGEETHQIRDGDPLSHQIEMAYTITLEREDPKWQIRTVTHTLVTATESDFLVTASLNAYEGDDQVFSKSWDTKIARDFN
tara:strand:+ start:22 stop:2046 length:2025 start_codon:yes stop_codon:yes gene_type:complete